MTARPLQILDLEPSTELVFKGPFSEVVTTKLTLKNPTNTHVGFKVKTTAPKQYCVRPNSGIIEPHENACVSVMLQPMEEVGEKNWPKHKFMVQSLVVDNNTTADSLDAAIKSAPKSSLMDSKLRCTFVEGPPVKEAAPSVPLTPSADDANPSQEQLSLSKESLEAPTGGASPLAPTESRSVQDAVEEQVPAMQQPTAGSTPAHVTSQGSVEKEQYAAENRLLKERTKKLADENAQLKVEADRLRQRFVQKNTAAASRGAVRGGGLASTTKPNSDGSPLNIVAIVLILLALLLGYLVGTYIN